MPLQCAVVAPTAVAAAAAAQHRRQRDGKRSRSRSHDAIEANLAAPPQKRAQPAPLSLRAGPHATFRQNPRHSAGRNRSRPQASAGLRQRFDHGGELRAGRGDVAKAHCTSPHAASKPERNRTREHRSDTRHHRRARRPGEKADQRRQQQRQAYGPNQPGANRQALCGDVEGHQPRAVISQQGHQHLGGQNRRPALRVGLRLLDWPVMDRIVRGNARRRARRRPLLRLWRTVAVQLAGQLGGARGQRLQIRRPWLSRHQDVAGCSTESRSLTRRDGLRILNLGCRLTPVVIGQWRQIRAGTRLCAHGRSLACAG